ncbi:unnamed protein product [Nippostrongylus brasiliensis]|uniref:Phosphatidylinositol 4-kinase alpha (inferred by orthology to a human protein) n=1 Tax=Nippostrongylus brasiliensis TaxID=27835 RepID=A0A0N4YH27_NIPBR|nr:unnamed protein product [Nippostrongylus brasiliensis]
MRNHFSTLYDIITKNIEKIKKPRNSCMKDIDDFVFKNIQCSAICLAKIEKSTLRELRRVLLSGLTDDLESQPLNHNFADELVPLLLRALANLPQMKWVDDGLVNKNDTHLLKLTCYVLGLLRSLGRCSYSADKPLISYVFPVEFEMPVPNGTGHQSADVDPPRVSSDDAWAWLDGGMAPLEKEVPNGGVQRLVKLYNKYGASFLCSHTETKDGSSSIKRFPYKTVSETLMLTCLSLMRERLSFGERRTTQPNNMGRKLSDELPRQSIAILAMTCGLELIEWAAIDDIDSDVVCSTMSARLFTANTNRVQLSQLPLAIQALSSLGGLAEKFPSVATATVVPILSRFLLEPAPILTKLSSETSFEKRNEERRVEENAAKRKSALDSLRNAAISALCRALKSSLSVDADSVQACLASLSSKLFVCSSANNFVVALVCENAIMTLGGIGVALVGSKDVPDMVLQIFLQRFANPPSPLDNVMVRCLANMWIAGARSIYDGVMKLFTQISIESSNRVYSQEPVAAAEHRYA